MPIGARPRRSPPSRIAVAVSRWNGAAMTARRRRIRATSSGRSSTLRSIVARQAPLSRLTAGIGGVEARDRLGQTVQELMRIDHAARRGGELDRQRQPIEGAADGRDSAERRAGGLEIGPHAGQPIDEQRDRGAARDGLGCRDLRRQRERVEHTVRSLRMPRGVRPVARIVSVGHRSSKAGRNATADATRSTGSSTASVRPSASASWSRSRMSAPCPSPTPIAAAISGSRSSGSSTGSRSTHRIRPSNGSASPRRHGGPGASCPPRRCPRS